LAEDLPAAAARAREAIEIAQTTGAAAPLSGGYFVRGYVRAVSGQLEDAEADLVRAVEISRSARDPGRQAWR
jgi:hypothetical protein